MASLEIKNIKSEPLKQLATQIDKSGISTKDGKIDDKELVIFQEKAKTELLDKKLITNDEYTAMFGSKISKTQEADSQQTNIISSVFQGMIKFTKDAFKAFEDRCHDPSILCKDGDKVVQSWFGLKPLYEAVKKYRAACTESEAYEALDSNDVGIIAYPRVENLKQQQ